ncbi:MAG: hypothetical protein ACXAD7_17920 [Candidatus Kariarchaeaceae archaeon]|jgi:hypothetical protein
MYNRIIDTIDHELSYRITSVLVFLFYLSRVLLAAEEDTVPLVPNIPFTFICMFLTFIITSIAQYLRSVTFSSRWLSLRLFLASIPTILGLVLVVKLMKGHKNKIDDPAIYYGLILIVIVLSFLSISSLILIFFLMLFDPIPGHEFYLLSLGIWGLIGITIGDIFGMSSLRTKLDYFYSTRKNRLIIVSVIYLIVIILLITTSSSNQLPISYNT